MVRKRLRRVCDKKNKRKEERKKTEKVFAFDPNARLWDWSLSSSLLLPSCFSYMAGNTLHESFRSCRIRADRPQTRPTWLRHHQFVGL